VDYPATSRGIPFDQPPRYLILGRDGRYGHEVPSAIRSRGIEPKQIMARNPWKNGVAERSVSTARRGLLDHVIVLNEHLQRRLACFGSHYLNDLPHLSPKKDAPAVRAVESPASEMSLSFPQFGEHLP
jgi:transposase InsO family protein